jgi:hypothetical protein
MKRINGSRKRPSDNNLGTPSEIKTWKILVGLKRQGSGAVILTLQHIPLLRAKLGTRNEIKT